MQMEAERRVFHTSPTSDQGWALSPPGGSSVELQHEPSVHQKTVLKYNLNINFLLADGSTSPVLRGKYMFYFTTFCRVIKNVFFFY